MMLVKHLQISFMNIRCNMSQRHMEEFFMEENRLIITLFGATGDLAARKLYPAIYRLYKNKHISKHFALIGTARREWTNEYFQGVVLNSIQSEIDDRAHAEEFISHFYYQAHDVNDAEHYSNLKTLAETLDEKYDTRSNRIFYVSLSPTLFPIITRHLKDQNCLTEEGFNRLIIEKPFGNDFKSAEKLQNQLALSFNENQIYRIDHYLGKGIVHSLDDFRFNNQIMKQLWNKENIDNVQISLAEKVGVEDRGDYYETSGVSKDMIQNHALQLLALVAMKPSEDGSYEGIRDAKIEVLKNIHKYESTEELAQNVVRGQYGESLDHELIGYRQEDKVSNCSNTETYFAARVTLNMPEWEGVPFYLRSGKRLNSKFTKIVIVFKRTSPNVEPNRLEIEIAPGLGYRLWLNQERLDYSNELEPIDFSYYYDPTKYSNMPVDYERLIYECIQGNISHFTHYLEVAHAWKFIDNIQELWSQMDEPTFPNYPAKSSGPQESDDLLAKYNTKWY